MTAKKDEEPIVETPAEAVAPTEGNEIGLVVVKEKLEDGREVSGRSAVLTVNGKETVLSADEIGLLSNLAQSAFLETH